MFFLRYPKFVLGLILLLCVSGAYLATQRVKFSFDLEDFFPTDDPDLAYFRDFKKRFEPDDNFIMVGLHREQGVFDSVFMQRALAFSLDFRRLQFPVSKILNGDSLDQKQYTYEPTTDGKGDSVLTMHPIASVQSILNFEYPVKTPLFGFTSIPAVHVSQPALYEQDKKKILEDERLSGTLLSKDAKTLVLYGKTYSKTSQEVAKKLIYGIHDLLDKHQFTESEYHLLGPSNFQTRLPEVQMREFAVASGAAGALIFLVMFLIFRRFWGVFVSLASILVGMLLFIGFLGAMGSELDTMAMLYPIIMIIVATSDVIHVMSKYVDELRKGHEPMPAIRITMKEIGMSVFLTSATTAIGFFSLYSSRVEPIRNFGINAGIGVMIAYLSVIFFTTTLLTFFRKDQIARLVASEESRWTGWMEWLYHFIRTKAKIVWAATLLIIAVSVWGISMINTNNRIEDLLPLGEKCTEDFKFFEQNLSGFRPMDFAITLKDTHHIEEYAVVKDIAKLEDYLRQQPEIQTVMSVTAIYKSINRALNGDRTEAYRFPETPEKFEECKRLAKRFLKSNTATPLVSADGKYTRVSARFLDIGSDLSRSLSTKLSTWVAANLNPSLAEYRQTGTGVLVDKNAEYMRTSLLWGLGTAVLVIALVMGLLYRSLKMMIISLIPNVVPLFIAGAIVGFVGIPLDAGVAIVFSIIFGIAVDDTIHILGRFRLLQLEGKNTDEAIHITLIETGKAIVLTSLILLSGFLILLLSSNPPAITVGLLISLTLSTALLFDLFLLPVLLRRWVK